MKKKIFAIFAVIMLIAGVKPLMASDNLLLVGNDLSVPVSCVQYKGVGYGFILRYATSLPDGIHWKMDLNTFTQLSSVQNGCISSGDDLAFNVSVIYQDIVYNFTFRYDPLADSEGLYWKMDVNTFGKADSISDFANDLVRSENECNSDLYSTRISELYLNSGSDYNCIREAAVWDYAHYYYENTAYLINSVSYENQGGKMLAKISRTRTATGHSKTNSEDVWTDSYTDPKTLVFENGKWKLYGNQKEYPGVSASAIVTSESFNQEQWAPVGVKQVFTQTDKEIVVFAELDNVHNGSSYKIKLLKPDGTIADETDEDVFDWGDYPSCVNGPSSVYYPIDIQDAWRTSLGKWKIEVYADDKKAGEAFFEYKQIL